ncbi:MAG: phosphoenolpyruvate carboxykinase domain-containing protein, partial [Synergistaceae bacterium]|nr:phosphoenolpyruvate carboxykinase domain-containing protein [Synergistaceae bacterium]
LEWIIKRAFGEAEAAESPIGYLPKPEDIERDGLDISLGTLEELLTVDKELWRDEAKGIREFYSKFGDKLPRKLRDELTRLEKNL